MSTLHSKDSLDRIFEAVRKFGARPKRIAAELGLTEGQVNGVRRRHREAWNAAVTAHTVIAAGTVTAKEEVTQRVVGDQVEAKSFSGRIKTVEDLLRHIQADMTRNEVVAFESTKNEVVMKDPDTGYPRVEEYFRVWVRLKPKQFGVTDLMDQMLSAALRDRSAPAVHTPSKTWSNVWQVLIIADPHFGKYAWAKTTGYQDFDLSLSKEHVLGCANELFQHGDQTVKPGRRTIAFLGDVFHYDTPHGTTTSGTPLERDGRMPKMVDVGTDTVLSVIERSAQTAKTDVLFVRGNHDEALTTFLQKTVVELFKQDPRVQVDASHTHRKYLYHDRTLLGFTHGDKAKKKLPGLMSHEARQWWADARYYEWHTGHTHGRAAEWQRPIEEVDGVLVRVAPAICPPDDWHADNGYTRNLRAMETFYYRPGGLLGHQVASPDFLID